MFDRMENLSPVLLAGLKRKIPLLPEPITALWKDFVPNMKLIPHLSNNLIYSIQIYEPGITFTEFNPLTPVVKWAAVPVTDKAKLPEGFEYCTLSGGLYAVFIHKGIPSDFRKTMRYIFQTWMPASGYQFEFREQFELMGDKYRHNDPASEEEVWIPVRIA